jgi:hypothetical protein
VEGRALRWWMKDLVDSELKAMGTYLALIYLHAAYTSHTFEAKPSGASITAEDKAMQLNAMYFAGRGLDARQALEASRMFIDRLFEHEDVLDGNKRRQVLIEIESEFYDEFVKGFRKYLRLDVIPKELKGKAREVLLDVRAQLYEKAMTPAGTVHIHENTLKEKIKTHRGLDEEGASKLISYLAGSGLAIRGLRFTLYYTFPAPCLSDEIIELLARPIERPSLEAKPFIPPPPKPERFDVRPSREVLEGIVASVFKDLGFEASPNVRKEPRKGGPIEVDVWAQRRVAGTRFSVYVSCKNWDRAVDRPVIDEETGRVSNLRGLPQLKVIIAKELTEPAREVAEADGFVVIELGRKAEADRAREIYELVYGTLNELFTSIAPPRLREIASRIADVRESLRKVEEELTSLLAR